MSLDSARPDQTTSFATIPTSSAVMPLVELTGLLEIEGRPEPVALTRFQTVIGRRNADLVLDDPDVSRQHAVIERYERGYLLRDLGSTNGSYVNGQRTDAEMLHPGDVIELGGTVLTFKIELA